MLPAGHFINLDMTAMNQNRLFCNKIWQATRFLFLLLEQVSVRPHSSYSSLSKEPKSSLVLNQWIMSKLHTMVFSVNSAILRYDFHHATESLFSFFYCHLCDVFVEAIKSFTGNDQQECAFTMIVCLDTALRCLAPFMPFLSEELYQRLHHKIAEHGIEIPNSFSVLIANYPENEVLPFVLFYDFLQ